MNQRQHRINVALLNAIMSSHKTSVAYLQASVAQNIEDRESRSKQADEAHDAFMTSMQLCLDLLDQTNDSNK